jgi:hypothetical protein
VGELSYIYKILPCYYCAVVVIDILKLFTEWNMDDVK